MNLSFITIRDHLFFLYLQGVLLFFISLFRLNNSPPSLTSEIRIIHALLRILHPLGTPGFSFKREEGVGQ